MAGPYSTDLRSRVLALIEAGETPEAAADRFAVARSTAYRWAAALRDEGRCEAKKMGGGPKPLITGAVEGALLGLLRANNKLTLAECRDRLAEATGVRVHLWTVSPCQLRSWHRARYARPGDRKRWRSGGRAGRERNGACVQSSKGARTSSRPGQRGGRRRAASASSRRTAWCSSTNVGC